MSSSDHAQALQQLRHRVDRADAHLVGLAARDRRAAVDADRLDAERVRAARGHEQRRRRAVGELARVARRDGSALGLERGRQLAQALDRGVGAVALVLVDDAVLFARLLALLLHHAARLHRARSRRRSSPAPGRGPCAAGSAARTGPGPRARPCSAPRRSRRSAPIAMYRPGAFLCAAGFTRRFVFCVPSCIIVIVSTPRADRDVDAFVDDLVRGHHDRLRAGRAEAVHRRAPRPRSAARRRSSRCARRSCPARPRECRSRRSRRRPRPCRRSGCARRAARCSARAGRPGRVRLNEPRCAFASAVRTLSTITASRDMGRSSGRQGWIPRP